SGDAGGRSRKQQRRSSWREFKGWGARSRRLLARRRRLAGGPRAPRPVEDVDRAVPPAEPLQPGAARKRRALAGRARRLERRGAAGEEGGDRRGVGAAGAVGGLAGVALTGDLDRLFAGGEKVDEARRVAAGDGDRLRPVPG